MMSAGKVVGKEVYRAWEERVIKAFYESGPRHTPQMPTDGAPSVVKRLKVMVVAVEATGNVPEVVVSSGVGLPQKRKVQMFHIGERKNDGVSYGLNEADKVFMHPACDVAGLTNYRQKVGEAPALEEERVPIERGCRLMEPAGKILRIWRRLSGKELPDELLGDLAAWLKSALEVMDNLVVCFHVPPPQHRVIVTPTDIRRKTGAYYLRNFSSSTDTEYATESDGEGLYCAVADNFVTSNYLAQNIQLEVSTYPDVTTCSSILGWLLPCTKLS